MSRPRLLIALTVLSLSAAACQAPDDPPEGRAQLAASPSPSPTAEPRLMFAVKGDWGAGTPEQAAVTSRMCETRKATPFDVVVTTGDNFYRPDGTATETNYHAPEACLVSRPGHQWRAVWGNHDVKGDSTATVLGAVERNYAWTAGPVQFFMLDSNRAADGAQEAWLAAELAGSQAPVKIAVFHHPPFTVGLHENNLEVQRRWVPLFEQFDVDLVLSGHNHAYEHSVVNEVHYVISGGGGAQLYPCVNDQPWLLTCLAVNHFLVVEAKGSALTVKALGTSGETIDSFEIGGTSED